MHSKGTVKVKRTQVWRKFSSVSECETAAGRHRNGRCMRPDSILFALCLLFAVAPFRGQATVIYTNMSNPPSYSSGSGDGAWGTAWYSSHFGGSGYLASATAFTPAANASLGQIELGLASRFFDPDITTITLATNYTGGTVLDSWTLSGFPNYLDCCHLTSVTPHTPITLQGGTQYWLIATAGSPDTFSIWGWGNLPAVRGINQGGGWTVGLNSGGGPAFQVLDQAAASTPEPSTSGLMVLAGLVGLGAADGRIQRSKNGKHRASTWWRSLRGC